MAQRNMPRQQQRPPQRKKPMPRGEGYRELSSEVLEEDLAVVVEKIQDAHEAYMSEIENHNTKNPQRNGDHLNNYIEGINRLSELAMIIRSEIDRRETAETRERDASEAEFDDMAETQVEGMKEEGKLDGDALGEYDLRAQNALRRKTGKEELGSFDELWDRAHAENNKFDKEQAKQKKKVGKEKEKSVIDAHQEARSKGDLEGGQDHITFSGLYDEAHRENEKRDEIKNSTEYQVEQSMMEILSNIDKATENRNKAVETYEKGGIWKKMRHPDSILDAAKNRKQVRNLTELKSELLAEEVGYADKKQELVDERVVLEKEQIDGDGFGSSVIEQMGDITMRMKILEKTHQERKERILNRLEKIGINVSSQIIKEVEPNLDSVGTNSNPLTGDEHSWKKDQENSVASDPNIQFRIHSLEQELKKNSLVSGASGFGLLKKFIMNKSDAEMGQYNKEHQEKGQEQVDNEIKSELDKYMQKIVEARLRRKRMEEMIKAEQKKSPIDINNALIIACSQRIVKETQELESYSESLREKVIAIGWKSKMRQIARPGAILGKAKERIGR